MVPTRYRVGIYDDKLTLTTARVENLPCEPGKQQTIHWDAKTPGFGLRVTTAGARSYIFESRLFGKTLRVTIGDARAWELGRARTEASRLKMLVDEGKDPREVKAEQRQALEARRQEAARQDVLFGQAWDAYIQERKPFWSERHFRDHVQHASEGGVARKRGQGLTQAGPLAALRALRLPDLTGPRIAQWLTAETATRPTMTALSFRLLRGFIRWAKDMPAYKGLIPTDSYQTRGVKDAVPRVKAKEGDCLQREQLGFWFTSVREIHNPVISAYLQGLLITGARREELAALRWEDVDFRWRSLTLNDKVEGTAGRTIPLTPYLSSLLLELKRLNEVPPTRRQPHTPRSARPHLEPFTLDLSKPHLCRWQARRTAQRPHRSTWASGLAAHHAARLAPIVRHIVRMVRNPSRCHRPNPGA